MATRYTTIDTALLEQAKKTATDISSGLSTLSKKGYGSTNIADIPQDIDIASLPKYTTPTRTPGLYQQEQEKGLMTTQAQADITRQADELAAQRRQAQIDAINQMYAPRISRATEEAKGRELRAKALALRTGNIGTGTEDPYSAETRKGNEEAMQALEQEKGAKIQEALFGIDKLRLDEIERLTKQKKETAEANLTLMQNRITQAENSIKALGAGGVTLEKLKTADPNAYNTLKDVAGMSDFEIASKLASANPKANAKMEYKDGVIISYYNDPTTGQLVVHSQRADINDGEEFQSIDGVGYGIKRDAQGNIQARKLTEKAYKPTDDTKMTEGERKAFINKQIGSSSFKKLSDTQKEDFIRANGGDPSDFTYIK